MSASQTAEPGLAEADAADGRRDVIAVALLILVTAALCLPLAEDYGVTYDEPWYVGKALYAFDWLGELLRDPRAAVSRECIDARWWARKGERREEQPGAYKLILGLTLGLGKSLLPAMAAARSATCLILCLGVGAMYAFARRAYGRTEAIAGCVAFLLMPRVFAHAHLAALDVPVAALSMVTLYAAWRAATARSWRWTAACGIAFGVALGTKVNAVLAPIIVVIWLLASTMRRRQGAKGAPVPWHAVARV
ncbi:MAG: glycosyltransferase family 39 protein, partial [Armatimonadota bacterium]